MGRTDKKVDILLTEDDDVYEDDFEMNDDECDVDEVFAADDGTNNSDSTNKWDLIISALEDVLLDKGFEEARNSFCRQHCHEFEDTPENKLTYTQLFSQYCGLLEAAIEGAVTRAVPGLTMQEFGGMLQEREGDLDAQVFDLLLSMSEFGAFKELMLAHKAEAQAGPQQALLGLQCCAMALHTEEQEDGEERPDLDMSLSVSPLMSPAHAAATAAAGGGGAAQGSLKQAIAATAVV